MKISFPVLISRRVLGPRPAFTLVELLTTIGIIAILSSLLLTGLRSARERGRRLVCAGNLHQLILGATMYSNDDRGGNFSNAVHDTNDVMTFLYPTYVKTLKTFICPSTQNYIRPDKKIPNPFTGELELLDLTDYAGGTKKPGMSYEIFGFMNYTKDTPNTTQLRAGGKEYDVKGVRKSNSTVVSYEHIYNAFGLKGIVAGPSRIWLILDGDDGPTHQNYPDPEDNHGSAGGNVSFCDGHVEWVRQKEYIFKYETSQDENRDNL